MGPEGPRGHPGGHSLGHPIFGDTLGDTPRDTRARRARETPVAGWRDRKKCLQGIYFVKNVARMLGLRKQRESGVNFAFENPSH